MVFSYGVVCSIERVCPHQWHRKDATVRWETGLKDLEQVLINGAGSKSRTSRNNSENSHKTGDTYTD